MATDQVQAGFVRYRRFLIAVSLAIACIDVLGLRFTQLSILGNTVEIHNPETVPRLAFIAWIWGLVQYAVWFRDVGAWRDFKQTVNSDCNSAIERRAVARAMAGQIPDYVRHELSTRYTGRCSAEEMSKIRYVCVAGEISGDGRQVDRLANVLVTAHLRTPMGMDASQQMRFEVDVAPAEWRRHYIAATIQVLLTRRFTLEYFAPFLIGLIPAVVWAHGHCSQRSSQFFSMFWK